MAGLLPVVKAQFFDNNGDPLNGGLIHTYLANTAIPLATYVDQQETAVNSNPVVLDAAGRADIWLATNQQYLIVVADSNDVTLYSTDYVSAPVFTP